MKRFIEERIIGILKQQESEVKTAADTLWVDAASTIHNISQNNFNTCKSKFGGMIASEAHRLRQLKAENSRLTDVKLKDVWAEKYYQ